MKNKIKSEEEALQEKIKKVVEKNQKLEEENKKLKNELSEANNKVLEQERERQLELAKLFVESYKINKMLKHILIIFLLLLVLLVFYMEAMFISIEAFFIILIHQVKNLNVVPHLQRVVMNIF